MPRAVGSGEGLTGGGFEPADLINFEMGYCPTSGKLPYNIPKYFQIFVNF